MNNRFRVEFLTIVLLLLSLGIAKAQNNDHDDEFNLDRTYKISEDGTLHLQSNDAHVRIHGTNRKDVHVFVKYTLDMDGFNLKKIKHFRMNVEERNGDLFVGEREDRKVSFLGIGHIKEAYTINIETPMGVSLDIKGDDDDYSIDNLTGNIEVEANDGDVSVERYSGNELNVTLDDGNLEVIGGHGKLISKIKDGSIDVRNGRYKEIDTQSGDGSIRIDTDLDDQGYYRMESGDGDIVFTVLSGGGSFNVRHGDGDVSVSTGFTGGGSKREDEKDYQLTGGNAQIRIITDDGFVRLNSNK